MGVELPTEAEQLGSALQALAEAVQATMVADNEDGAKPDATYLGTVLGNITAYSYYDDW